MLAVSRLGGLRSISKLAPPRGAAVRKDIDRLRGQIGGLESRKVAELEPGEIGRAEFRVFSQFGEDGIIQFLVQRVAIENDLFVELGVEDYSESNTRFLLVHDNWRGLIVDAAESMHHFLRSSDLAWRHEIDAKTAFVDRHNVNDLIATAGIEGDIGLLSIDLDGNDYWILEAIEVVSPRILVTEYNSVFGVGAAVTVPYHQSFDRKEKHWSWLYWGASLAALAKLAGARGYALVGGNRAGNNAFFVRRDVLGEIPEVDVSTAYAPSRFRESRDRSGELSYVSGHERQLRLIADMSVVDVESGHDVTIATRFGLD
jgi:hypothetical protein